MSREICGECKYNKYSTTEKEFYCSNTDSDNYGIPTMYDDSCEDFEEIIGLIMELAMKPK